MGRVDWHNGRMVAFDLETTSVDPHDARIVTACVAQVKPGVGVDEQTWLVNPGVPIPPETTEIHGVTDEQAQADGADPAMVVSAIADQLGAAWDLGLPVVAMNAAYDLTVLDTEMGRHGLGTLRGLQMLVVDPLVCDRKLDRFRKGKKRLSDLCQVYGVELGDDAHTAEVDAVAAARVVWRMVERFPDDLQVDLWSLQEAQASWHREWAVDFEGYLRRVKDDPSIVIERGWPLRAAAEVSS